MGSKENDLQHLGVPFAQVWRPYPRLTVRLLQQFRPVIRPGYSAVTALQTSEQLRLIDIIQ